MSRKKIFKILVPAVIIAVCVAIIATVLVFTLRGKNDGQHIVIGGGENENVKGELEITLIRTKLERVTLDKNGLPFVGVDDRQKDFSRSDDNIFGIDGNILIGPDCYFSADMTIENNKPYAFDYFLEIIPENGESLLTEQLELTVIIDGQTFIKRTLQNGLTTKDFPRVEAGEKGIFTVKLEYLDLKENDLTKNTTLAFDLTVHARLAQN